MIAVTRRFRPDARYCWFSYVRSLISPSRWMKTARARLLRDSPLLSSRLAPRRSSGSSSQLSVASVRSSRPSSRSAAATPFWRGYDASWRRMSEAVTVPVRMEAATRRMSGQCARISATLMRPAISGFERGIGRRSAEAVEAPALQVRDTRREQEPEQRTQGEDVVGIATTIGVVAMGRDLTLVIKQAVEHMHGFAGSRCNHLGVERRVAVGEMRVELDARVITVVRVEAAGVATEAACPEELTVRRRREAVAEQCGERLSLLLIDQALKGQSIRLVADVPVRRPGQLPEACDTARFRRHLRQEVGDANARQHGV